jgi:carboxypeptidase T
MYGLHCVASFTFEVGSAFYQKCNEFEAEVFPSNYEALIYATKVASAPFKIPKGPDVMSLEIESTITNSVTVTVLVSDTERSVAYDEAFASTGSQAIAIVRMFVDEHPYTTQNPDAGKSMNPVDANGFNSPTERAFLTIDTQSLASGQHVLYIEAEDIAGDRGPISAAFFSI